MPLTRFRQLDAALIVITIERLRDRIEKRFPGSGLGDVSDELLTLAREATVSIEFLRRPHWPLRMLVGSAFAIAGAVLFTVTTSVPVSIAVDRTSDFVQVVEATINILVFLGVALLFLLSLESRLKRRTALESLHQLRSIVHIVDMHQLTKDPELAVMTPDQKSATAREMTVPELGRYLDYCSELLSLASKVAALFVQHFNDPVVLDTVNEIESLASDQSSKIWQKITLLERGQG